MEMVSFGLEDHGRPYPALKREHDLAAREIRAFLSAPPRPEQDCKNDQPNDAPANPCDVRVSRLPFEDFLMDAHYAMSL